MTKLSPLIAALALLMASATMIYVIEVRSVVRLDPELERLAIAYLREQAQRSEYIRKADQANRNAEREMVLPMPPQPQLRFDTTNK